MSENVNHAGKCQRCGATLAVDAPEGLCPRCLMALSLGPQTEIPDEAIGPHGTKVVKPPPPLAEIARHFPQLEILECLGRGGMGVVYKARQPKLNRFVALKLLAPEMSADTKFAERFLREAQALARLNHPNIVTVYDFGEADGFYFLLMEFVDGANLRQLLREGRMKPEGALTIVPRICEALQFAHEQGVVHRDIKPENILLDRQGRVKIADFGIAKIVEATPLGVPPPGGPEATSLDRLKPELQTNLTAEQILGTPQYMAPEQMERPQTVDHRADIYSLGVVFYEMLTGELPLGRFQPPSKKVQIDVRLDEVVLHALEKEPERRYQHASEVKTDVETIATTPRESGESAGQKPASSTPTKVSLCYISTPEHLHTFRGRFLSIYQGKGELRLDSEALRFHSGWPTVTIPLSSIRKLAQGEYPASAKPVPLHYIAVSFAEHDAERTLLFTPVRSEGVFPPWEANKIAAEWLSALQEGVRARTGRTLPLERFALALETFWWAIVKTFLLTAAICTVIFAMLPIIVERRLPNRVSEWMWGTITAAGMVAGLLAVRWWSRQSADGVGNLDMLTPSKTEPALQNEPPGRAQSLRIKAWGFALAATCMGMAGCLFAKEGHLLPSILSILGVIGFIVAAHRHTRAAANIAPGSSPGTSAWLQCSLISDDVAARWAQFVCFAGALGVFVLGFYKLVRLALQPHELFFGMLLVLILSLVMVVAGLLTGSRSRSTPRAVPSASPTQTGRPNATSQGAEEQALAEARRQVKAPAIGLLATGILNWILIPLAFLLLGPPVLHSAKAAGISQPALAVFALALLALCGFIIYAALRMMGLERRRLAVAAGVLAMVVSPGNLVGLPVGIWALVVLNRREVREAFDRVEGERPRRQLSLVGRRNGQRAVNWPVLLLALVWIGLVAALLFLVGGVQWLTGVVVVALLLKLALAFLQRWTMPVEQLPPLDPSPNQRTVRRGGWRLVYVGLALLALAVFSGRGLFPGGQPNLTVTGTVTDAVSGRPIAGARVDDNRYGASPGHAPQQAWTDASGHFELKTWYEEHTLAASAPGYETRLATLLTKPFGTERELRMDFQLPPAITNAGSAPGAVIQRVVVRGREAHIEGRSGTGCWFVLSVGTARYSCHVPPETSFTATFERAMFGQGFNLFINDAKGTQLEKSTGNKVGPMTAGPGRIMLREGTLLPESDGSFVVGVFQPESAAPLPIKVRLEKSGGPFAK